MADATDGTADAPPADAAGSSSDSADGSGAPAPQAAVKFGPLFADPPLILTGGKTNLAWTIAGEVDKVMLHAEVQTGAAPDDQDVTQQTQDGSGTVAAFEVSPPDGVITYSLIATPKGGSSSTNSDDLTVHVVPLPTFEAAATGLRRRGAEKGDASLTACKGQVIEAFWSVKNGELVQIARDDQAPGDPRRVTDGCCPLALAGLEEGAHTFKLIPGVASGDAPIWAPDSALTLTLTLGPALAVTRFFANPEPDDDGKDHLSQDLQVANGTKIKLQFEAAGAKQVQISAGDTSLPPIDLDDKGAGSLVVDPADQQTSYTAVALSGDIQSDPAGPVTVHFHAPDDLVSPLADVGGGPSAATLLILAANGDATADVKLSSGTQNGLQLKWTVTAAKSARLTAKSLVQESGKAASGGSESHVANDQLLTSGLDLTLDDTGSGGGVVIVDPGPAGSVEYTVTMVPSDGSAAQLTAAATAYVANFNVQLMLPDGSDLARNKNCVLEIPNLAPVTGTTNAAGELWLWLANSEAATATLRVLEGDFDLGAWDLQLSAAEGVLDAVADPQPATGNAAPAAGDTAAA